MGWRSHSKKHWRGYGPGVDVCIISCMIGYGGGAGQQEGRKSLDTRWVKGDERECTSRLRLTMHILCLIAQDLAG